jgi:hypothetical protein
MPRQEKGVFTDIYTHGNSQRHCSMGPTPRPSEDAVKTPGSCMWFSFCRQEQSNCVFPLPKGVWEGRGRRILNFERLDKKDPEFLS